MCSNVRLHLLLTFSSRCRSANFEELTTSNALVRPGAMKSIGKVYLDRKSGKKAVEYISPLMKDFTSDTYGLIVYQEQVMQACVVLGGMSMGKANKVRKVIGKKQDAAGLDKYKKEFVDWCDQAHWGRPMRRRCGVTLRNTLVTRSTSLTLLLTLCFLTGLRG